jgi:hypothetical protein
MDVREQCMFYPSFSDTPAGIVATVHFWRHLIASTTIERLGQNMRSIAEALTLAPQTTVGSLALL